MALAVVAQLIIIALAFHVGASRSPYAIHVGSAYYGTDEVTIKYNGWFYGGAIPFPWHDSAGWHDGGKPSCMPQMAGSIAHLRFATVSAADPATGSKPLVWIDCSGSSTALS
ncbi:hypothetical protein acdb102_49270 [Acidothermaceae bacterium B102]|nr:hypothetical protein acdb102_49270 [Acidothermaceae bacterium B102]